MRRRWRSSRARTVVVISQMKLNPRVSRAMGQTEKRAYNTARNVRDGREIAASARLRTRSVVMACVQAEGQHMLLPCEQDGTYEEEAEPVRVESFDDGELNGAWTVERVQRGRAEDERLKEKLCVAQT